MVGVLMGHHDRVEVGEVGKPGENVPGSIRIRWSPVSTRRQAWPREVIRMPTNVRQQAGGPSAA